MAICDAVRRSRGRSDEVGRGAECAQLAVRVVRAGPRLFDVNGGHGAVGSLGEWGRHDQRVHGHEQRGDDAPRGPHTIG